MIRVLHIVSKLSINSGVMNVIMNYYRHIDRTKIQFDFLYFEESSKNFKDEIILLGGEIHYIEKPSIRCFFDSIGNFDKFFKAHINKYKIIHLHEVYLVHLISYFSQKYNIKHLITHAHTTKYSDNPKNAMRNRIMCFGVKYSATDYFACSKAAGEFYYGKKTVERGQVKIINNAIELRKYKYEEQTRNMIRKDLNIENKFVIGNIGRLAPPKNHMFLLRVFLEVQKIKKDAVLLLVGDGPLRKDVEEKVRNLGLEDKVIFLGIRKDIPNVLMAMDVFVLPSLFEGVPISAVEAQATGLTCILSSVITKEVDIGKSIYLDLEDDCSAWINNILSQYDSERHGFTDKTLKQITFSIEDSYRTLEKYYLVM